MPKDSRDEVFSLGSGASGGQIGWRCRLDQTYDLLTRIRQTRTCVAISELILLYVSNFGATGLLAGVIPPVGAMRREQMSHVLLDAWPQEWSLRYFSQGYLNRDPTIDLVRRVSKPFIWSEITKHCEVSAAARRVMQEATEFRLKDGLTLAFSSLERRPIGFSIAGERLELDPSERRAVELVTACALAQVIEIAACSEKRETVRLSPRQHDVLRWAAEGLTVDEIADRLGISSHTADTHLRAIREKLGATSTIRAVAEAFRIGLIT